MRKIDTIDGKILCPACGQHKSIDDFYTYQGAIKRPCKDCKLIYQKNFYQENKNDIELYRKVYYQKNRDDLLADQKDRSGKRKDEIALYQSEYREVNKVELQSKKRIYRKNRMQNDPSFKLRNIVSNTIFQALKYVGSSKNGASILEYLPYSIGELKEHLEAKFEPWMIWQNWGTYNKNTWDDNDSSTWTWQIDHVIPQASLPYMTMMDSNFIECWSLANLRPYSAKQNVIKGRK